MANLNLNGAVEQAPRLVGLVTINTDLSMHFHESHRSWLLKERATYKLDFVSLWTDSRGLYNQSLEMKFTGLVEKR